MTKKISATSGSQVRDIRKIKKFAEARTKREAEIKKILSDNGHPDLRAEAEAFVESDPLMSRIIETASNARSLIDLAVHATKKATEKEFIEAIARTYAMWILSRFSRRYDHIAVQALEQRKRANPKTTKLHLFVEAMISHAGDDQRANSQLCNRDVQAIRWLNHQKIPPCEVPALFRERDEGVDIWARKWAESQREKQDTAADAPRNKKSLKQAKFSCTAPKVATDPCDPPSSPSAVQSNATVLDNETITNAESVGDQPDFEIIWRDNTTKNCTIFRFARPIGKSLDDLAAFKLFLGLTQKAWPANSSEAVGGDATK